MVTTVEVWQRSEPENQKTVFYLFGDERERERGKGGGGSGLFHPSEVKWVVIDMLM